MFITGAIFYLFINDLFTEGLYNALGNKQITQAVHFSALTCSTFTHYVFPTLIIVDYLLFSKPHRLIRKDFQLILLFPISYSIFHSLLGLSAGQYLYPFLDPNRMGGWPMIGLITFALSLMFIGIASGLFALRRRVHMPKVTLIQPKTTIKA